MALQDPQHFPPITDRDQLQQLCHDLRTPLNAIVGLSQLLSKSQPLTAKQQEMADTLHKSAQSLREMIDTLVGADGQATAPQEAVPAQPAGNISVLLAEDHPANILIATTVLESLGYRCDVAKDGGQALEKLSNGGHYDVVLMDVQMPGIDGYTATRRLREEERKSGKKRMPVIGLTAHVLKENIEKCYDSGMDGTIGKPFTAEELQAKIASLLASNP